MAFTFCAFFDRFVSILTDFLLLIFYGNIWKSKTSSGSFKKIKRLDISKSHIKTLPNEFAELHELMFIDFRGLFPSLLPTFLYLSLVFSFFLFLKKETKQNKKTGVNIEEQNWNNLEKTFLSLPALCEIKLNPELESLVSPQLKELMNKNREHFGELLTAF